MNVHKDIWERAVLAEYMRLAPSPPVSLLSVYTNKQGGDMARYIVEWAENKSSRILELSSATGTYEPIGQGYGISEESRDAILDLVELANAGNRGAS